MEEDEMEGNDYFQIKDCSQDTLSQQSLVKQKINVRPLPPYSISLKPASTHDQST